MSGKPLKASARDFLLNMAAAMVLLTTAATSASAYDPLSVPEGFSPNFIDLEVLNARRNRKIPIRVWLPGSPVGKGAGRAVAGPAPALLFSHGLGGTREGSGYLGKHWSARGYAAVFIQHPGSDDSVWRGKSPGFRRSAMEDAASGRNFLLRARDVPAVLDALATWNRTPGHPLEGRLDLSRVGMSGHSFGAVTTQAVSGQTMGRGILGGLLNLSDPRIAAAVVMSPSSPRRGKPSTAFGKVPIPWLLMTGTHDLAKIGAVDMESRLSVYPALPPGGKYEVVLNGAEHSAFTERSLPGDSKMRNPNHHKAILALTTAFWDSWIRGDAAAREWLDGNGPSKVLETGDRWQKK